MIIPWYIKLGYMMGVIRKDNWHHQHVKDWFNNMSLDEKFDWYARYNLGMKA